MQDLPYKRAFLATESFRDSSFLHIHGLARLQGGDYHVPPEYGVWSELFHAYGRSRVQVVNSQVAVSNYVAKYVVKEATSSYDFYGDEGAWSERIPGDAGFQT